ncbi:MaoC family dehydratase N-terminal domain-containing protein [Nocardioides sp.]|uniref:FAS1-like dehydratase domain-containing protein n=1 Tax=Nocardioides sp. TaxID=35761 RepID=UPI00262D4724|nr:MaoC family dehydratase N-terminal domain-containing protein [Nocardioides sp.]
MFTLVVHGTHLMQFARAIGDQTPAYDEIGRLCADGTVDALVAPPTFLMAADHFDPDFPRRPRPGQPWLGTHDPRPNPPIGFHMEQHFTFHQPVRAGQVLVAEARPGAAWEKSGRRVGTMRFAETLTDYRTPAGDLVATARWVQAHVQQRPAEASAPAVTERGTPLPGEGWETVLTTELTRAQLVMYAGASGDFAPLHTDELYARERGYPGVFAHGMLTMGMSGRGVTDRFGHAAVRAFGGRMTGQAWPGDRLVATTRITAETPTPEGRVVDLAVTTRNQSGTVLFAGTATVLVED